VSHSDESPRGVTLPVATAMHGGDRRAFNLLRRPYAGRAVRLRWAIRTVIGAWLTRPLDTLPISAICTRENAAVSGDDHLQPRAL